MRIAEHLLVQAISNKQLVIIDESAGTEILVPMEAANRLIEAVSYFRRVLPDSGYLPPSVFPAEAGAATISLMDESEHIPTRVQINPNLRLDSLTTVVDLNEDVSGDMPEVGDQVEVYTGALLGWVGTGRVTVIDREGATMELAVDWPLLRGTH